ncbi:hypothetical protein AHAS_Ahas04G0113600 [Arachis hypogaea]
MKATRRAWHANSSTRKGIHLGVPLGVEGVACQALIITWVCHLKTQVWHTKLMESH